MARAEEKVDFGPSGLGWLGFVLDLSFGLLICINANSFLLSSSKSTFSLLFFFFNKNAHLISIKINKLN